ncbi:MAG: ATP-binding protein [Pseudomonadales bacterium]|nr:ATP-binding protein [Pseudomonadales bacterium]
MIKGTFGITKEPFSRINPGLLAQQKKIFDLIKIHSQHGGFSVIIGNPGVGKSILREHIETLGNERDTVVASFSQTMHTYTNILKQLAESFRIDAPTKTLEKELIQTAYRHIKDRKVLYTLIDEAHLMDMQVLRKLRLLFDRFPKKHNLVLFGQRDLLYYLSMNVNEDIKSRITYSENIFPLNDDNLEQYILVELDAVGLGHHTYDKASVELILRSVQGNLRLCRNLCYSSLIEACRDGKRTVTTTHINNVLVQPHWRSHEELIKQQVTS